MNKTEYRSYIGSEEWQERRKSYLSAVNECNRCGLPRWLCIVAYDQDLHVHHRSYANLGHEEFDDLEPLCKRCHELATFRRTKLHEPMPVECTQCGKVRTWDTIGRICDICVGSNDIVRFIDRFPNDVYEIILEAASKIFSKAHK